MKERGIIMSAPMVLALLDGRKTQTRRIIKRQPRNPVETFDEGVWSDTIAPVTRLFACPYGVVGDRLWVRETFWYYDAQRIYYRADGEFERRKWRSSIHMPRWASRITLELTGVRVERVQDISGRDIQAEGFPYEGQWHDGARVRWYHHLWDSLHGKGAWDLNPWVWALEFPRFSNENT